MEIGGISLVSNPLYHATESKLARRENAPVQQAPEHTPEHSEADGDSDLVSGGKLDTVA